MSAQNGDLATDAVRHRGGSRTLETGGQVGRWTGEEPDRSVRGLTYFSIIASMRRPVWLRAFIAVWSLWLQSAILDPGSFDACPEHGRHAAQVVPHNGHSARAGHEHGTPADHKSHSCTCLGACCCAPAALPASGVQAPEAVVAVLSERRVVAVDAFVASRPHALPFANGPPGQA